MELRPEPPLRKSEKWDIHVTFDGVRRTLQVWMSRPALKAAMPLLRAKGYSHIFPQPAKCK